MSRVFGALLGAIVMVPPALASGFDAALGDFARDVSGGDSKIAAQVEQIIAVPPSTLEEIGFYGAESASASERKFRAVVFRLSEAGYILGFEDKYIHEMPYVLQDLGHLDAKANVTQLLDRVQDVYGPEGPDDPGAEAARVLAGGFEAHVRAIEAAAHADGKALLYVDLPLGDTFHLIVLPAQAADDWRDVAFLETETARFAITAPQWNVYYDFLGYALLLRDVPASPVAGEDMSALLSLQDKGYAP